MAARATMATTSDQVAARARSSSCRARPIYSRWAWASMKPGIRVAPARSRVPVPGPFMPSISSLLPTARIKPSFTATASALGCPASTVTMFPLTMINSGAVPFWE